MIIDVFLLTFSNSRLLLTLFKKAIFFFLQCTWEYNKLLYNPSLAEHVDDDD